MTDIMPQDEIDALLAAVSGTQAESKPTIIDGKEDTAARVKMYDYRRPQFMTDSAEVRLRDIARAACDGIEAAFGSTAGIVCTRETLSVDQLSYGEYVRSLSSPTLISTVAVEPLPGSIAIEMMPSLGYALIDVLAGRDIRDVTLNLGFTADEAREAVAPLAAIAESFCQAFRDIAELSASVDSVIDDPSRAALCAEGEMGALITLDAKVEYVEGIITIFLPRRSCGLLIAALEESGTAPQTPSNNWIIDIPLRVRAASLAQVKKLSPGKKLEIDAESNAVVDMNAPMENR